MLKFIYIILMIFPWFFTILRLFSSFKKAYNNYNERVNNFNSKVYLNFKEWRSFYYLNSDYYHLSSYNIYSNLAILWFEDKKAKDNERIGIKFTNIFEFIQFLWFIGNNINDLTNNKNTKSLDKILVATQREINKVRESAQKEIEQANKEFKKIQLNLQKENKKEQKVQEETDEARSKIS